MIDKEQLAKLYPFLKKNPLGRKDDDDFNWLDQVPDGWLVLMPCLLEDLRNAFVKDNISPSNFEIKDIKEKWGQLTIFSTYGENVEHILSVYSQLSTMFCINCGRPHVKMTTGWLSPYCKDCWKEEWGEWVEDELCLTLIRYNSDKMTTIYDLSTYYERVLNYVE